VETIDLNSWESFEKSVSSLFSEWKKLKTEKHPLHVSTPLFRGHSNASWKLETTLERFIDRPIEAGDYCRTIRSVRPAVVSITGKEWNIPEFKSGAIPPTGYEFMIYLRHHGFPSPLLDWTRSPYVAAFFAFRSPQVSKDGRVAIYSYVEYSGQARTYYVGSPVVHGLGPYVESHKRHYAQQCEYTICWKEIGNDHVYSSHETAFADKTSDQGVLRKYTLPASERKNSLKQLQRMNVTAFSLFGSEESLMETLAYQEIEDR
jgi:hypothetical protein